MIIDKSLIENGITPVIIDKLIQEHSKSIERYNRLKNYYDGNHAILNRQKSSSGTANNTVVCNHAKYIVDMIQSYLVGNPVTYSAVEEKDIEALKDAYFVQDIANIDSELEKQASIYGRAYELIYADSTPMPRSVILSPMNTFVVYDNTALQSPLFAVYYYKRYDLDNNCKGVVCNLYSDTQIITYTNNSESWLTMQAESTVPHYFGTVPVIEYKNNAECQGDFEQLISLIDAYNLLASDRVNDKEQFVDAFLFLSAIELDSEEAKKLKEERILMGFEGAKAEYLSKVMQESDIKVLRDDLKEDIHRFSMVPDLSDESFGNNLSGVAIKYKLLGFEQNVKNKERYFSKGLKSRFTIYNTFLNKQAKMELVPVYEVDIVFNRNLPVNELEISQMINNLSGIVSTETLLGQIDFVTDAREELEIAQAEAEEKEIRKVKALEPIAQGGGY